MITIDLNKINIKQAADQAADIITKDGIIISPTDTIYGIYGDVFSTSAYKKIFHIKKRDYLKTVSWQIKEYDEIMDFVEWNKIPNNFNLIPFMQEIFPGPVTLILPVVSTKLPSHLNHLTTIGFRIPDHPFTKALSERLVHPVSTTSANRSGDVYTHDVEYIKKVFSKIVDAIIIEKPKINPVASTIFQLNPDGLHLIREGAVLWNMILKKYKNCIG